MARLAMARTSAEALGRATEHRYYLTILLDGLSNTAEATLKDVLWDLPRRFPAPEVLFTVLHDADEIRLFKLEHGLRSTIGPSIVITEENPFSHRVVPGKAVVNLAALKTPDEIKNVLAVITEQSHDEQFLKRAKRGELFRQLRDVLATYGDKILAIFSI
jgi:hypothetical protein